MSDDQSHAARTSLGRGELHLGSDVRLVRKAVDVQLARLVGGPDGLEVVEVRPALDHENSEAERLELAEERIRDDLVDQRLETGAGADRDEGVLGQ